MSTPLRLAAFAAGLAVVFLLAFSAGRAVGPWSPQESRAPHDSSMSETTNDTDHESGEEPHDD